MRTLSFAAAACLSAAALTLISPAAALAQPAPPVPPAPRAGAPAVGSHDWNGLCMASYRIIRLLRGEVSAKPDPKLDRYPWTARQELVAHSPQNWAYREKAAEEAYRAGSNAGQADADVAEKLKAAELAANVLHIFALGRPGVAPPQMITVEANVVRCDAGLKFDPGSGNPLAVAP